MANLATLYGALAEEQGEIRSFEGLRESLLTVWKAAGEDGEKLTDQGPCPAPSVEEQKKRMLDMKSTAYLRDLSLNYDHRKQSPKQSHDSQPG